MLQLFRNNAQSWVVKIILGLIILSFVGWGISDVILRYINYKPIAIVAGHDITREEFAEELKRETLRYQSALNMRLSVQQLKAAGVFNAVINRLVNQITLDNELKRLNMDISNETIRGQIQAMPVFHTQGKFDPAKFSSLLKQQGMNEQMFIKEARKNLLSQQFLGTIAQTAMLPEGYKKQIVNALAQERSFAFITIESDKMAPTEKGSESKYRNFYEQYKDNYKVPEERDITLLHLDREGMKRALGVTDTMVDNYYNSKKDVFQLPERRDVERLTYSDKAKAKKALKLIQSGKSLEKVAADIKDGEYEAIGLVAENQLPKYAAAEVFKTPAGKYTQIMESGANFNIYMVTKVEAARGANLNEMRDDIETLLINEHRGSKLDMIRNEIDDALASGDSIDNVAKRFNLSTEHYKRVRANGTLQDGSFAFENPQAFHRELLQKSFELDQGIDSGFIDTANDEAFVVMVDAIHPSQTPSFETIKPKVEKDWQQNQQDKAALTLAKDIVSLTQSYGDFTKLADKFNLSLTTNHTYSRLDLSEPDSVDQTVVSPAALEQAFMLTPGTCLPAKNAKGYVVILAHKDGKVKISDEKRTQLMNNLDNMVSQDTVNATVEGIRNNLKVEVNQAILEQMFD